jgi:hypothetical protein
MASESEPIKGSGGFAPSGVQERSPRWGFGGEAPKKFVRLRCKIIKYKVYF